MFLFSWLLQILLVLLSVAFFTLFERKVMGLFHMRLGPNKVSFVGLLQPLLDAFKLLSKQTYTPLRSNKFVYNFSPIFSLFMSLFLWVSLPCLYFTFMMNYSLLVFFCMSSILVFGVLMAGWSSNSKYSLIGSLRSVAQSISYEAVFSTILIIIMLVVFSFSISSVMKMSNLLFLYFFPLWVICTLAETHRAPFDFSESESELVSGFNTEYSGAYFAFIFLSEYSVLLFSCFLIVMVFFGFMIFSSLILIFSSLLMSYFFIWVRVTFCRFRYDMLMMVCWKMFLPLSLLFLVLMIVMLVLL